MFLRHLAASFSVGTDVVLFECNLLGFEEHPYQFAGEAAALGEKQDVGKHLSIDRWFVPSLLDLFLTCGLTQR
jgi:hypothetical protein